LLSGRTGFQAQDPLQQLNFLAKETSLLCNTSCFNCMSKSTTRTLPSQQGGFVGVTKADGPILGSTPTLAASASFSPHPIGSAQAQLATSNAASRPLSIQPHLVLIESSSLQQCRGLSAMTHPQPPKTRERLVAERSLDASIECSPVQQGRMLCAMAHPQSPKTQERLVAERSLHASIECSPVQQGRMLSAMTHPQSPQTQERLNVERSLDAAIECSPVQQGRVLSATTHPQSPKTQERLVAARSLDLQLKDRWCNDAASFVQ